jgi:hypothetical protein
MLRPWTRLFDRNPKVGASRAPHRTAPATRPRVEALDPRTLLATGLFNPVTSLNYSPSPLKQEVLSGVTVVQSAPPIYLRPYLVNHSVALKGPGGNVQGTVTFTSQSGLDFQGTFVSNETNSFSLAFGADRYSASFDIHPGIPISGSLSSPATSSSGDTTWALSFSGSSTGTVTETRNYFYDNPANPNDPREGMAETMTWMVSDTQSVNFSGTLTVSASGWTLGGTFHEQDSGQWVWSDDSLLQSDPNHREHTSTSLNGHSLDFSVTKMISGSPVM